MYYAHSTRDQDRSHWQPLSHHSLNVANLADQFGQWIGIARGARLAGLLHDLGKYTPEFQARADFKDTEQFYARIEGREVEVAPSRSMDRNTSSRAS